MSWIRSNSILPSLKISNSSKHIQNSILKLWNLQSSFPWRKVLRTLVIKWKRAIDHEIVNRIHKRSLTINSISFWKLYEVVLTYDKLKFELKKIPLFFLSFWCFNFKSWNSTLHQALTYTRRKEMKTKVEKT